MALRNILVVDDRAGDASSLGTRLTAFGYGVTVSSSAQAAALAEQLEPHLLLVDASTEPDASTLSVAEELRRKLAVPIVVILANAEDATLRRAHIVEPFGYLLAPFTDRELGATLELAFCRYESARQVHELEDRFFTSSIDLLCFLDFDGFFKRLNPAWEQTLGFTRTELMSRPFIEFVHPDDRQRTLDQNRQVRGGGRALGFENRYRCKDGTYRWLLWNAAPDSGARVIYSVARDVTDRKQAEEERERLLVQLQAALAEVRSLQEILPICAYCRKIRDDADYWQHVEGYISSHTNSRFSHSICPSC